MGFEFVQECDECGAVIPPSGTCCPAPQPSSEGREADGPNLGWRERALSAEHALASERAAREAVEAERDNLIEQVDEYDELLAAAEQRVAILEEQSEVQGQRAEDAERERDLLLRSIQLGEGHEVCKERARVVDAEVERWHAKAVMRKQRYEDAERRLAIAVEALVWYGERRPVDATFTGSVARAALAAIRGETE